MFDCVGRGFSAVAGSQLRKDAGDIVPHGPLTEEQGFGDLTVRFAFRDQDQDVLFLLAEDRKGRSFFFLNGTADFLEYPLGHHRVQKGIPSPYGFQ